MHGLHLDDAVAFACDDEFQHGQDSRDVALVHVAAEVGGDEIAEVEQPAERFAECRERSGEFLRRDARRVRQRADGFARAHHVGLRVWEKCARVEEIRAAEKIEHRRVRGAYFAESGGSPLTDFRHSEILALIPRLAEFLRVLLPPGDEGERSQRLALRWEASEPARDVVVVRCWRRLRECGVLCEGAGKGEAKRGEEGCAKHGK